MGSSEFAGMSIYATGTPDRINTAMEATFRMLPATAASPDIRLIGNGYPKNEVNKALPEWINARLEGIKLGLEPTMLYGEESGIVAAAEKDGFVFCAWIEASDSEVRFACSMDDAGSRVGMFQPVVIPVFREALARKSCFLIHGAAVQCPNGKGLLIIAPSGGGKTTTALSLVRQGAKLLGDDLIGIRAMEGKTMAFGIPEPMNLTDETIGFFDETKGFAHTRPAEGYVKKAIYPEDVFGKDCLLPSCRLHAIVFVHLSEGMPEVKPLPPGESLKRLILSHAFTKSQKTEPSTLSSLCGFLSDARSYELHTGSDPVFLGKWLAQAISDMC